MNNVVAGFCNFCTEEGSVLTIDCAVVGYCAYQGSSFPASDHIEKLVQLFKMSRYVGLFLYTVVNLEHYKYSYGRKFN